MKNKLIDLNDHLFAQIERLSEEGITAEQLEIEAKRTEGIVQVADKIIENAKTTLAACKLVADHGDRFLGHMPMIAGPREPDR